MSRLGVISVLPKIYPLLYIYCNSGRFPETLSGLDILIQIFGSPLIIGINRSSFCRSFVFLPLKIREEKFMSMIPQPLLAKSLNRALF